MTKRPLSPEEVAAASSELVELPGHAGHRAMDMQMFRFGVVQDDGAELQVLPDSVAVGDEDWRLLRAAGSHLVVGGDGATLSVE